MKLLLTDMEKQLLRKAKIKMADLGYLSIEEISERIGSDLKRAHQLQGLVVFQRIPSIGYALAEKLVFVLGIYSLDEIRHHDGASLFDRLEQRLGVWTDGCVEDQLRCVIHHAHYPHSSKQWFHFTEVRKSEREKNGYPKERPSKAWYE
ncbi:Pathogenicity locus [Alkalihalobacillus pseudalcaliphilus]|nr:Pathogenicity locus [Alkalihalobacillus pseudalcaliphilus]